MTAADPAERATRAGQARALLDTLVAAGLSRGQPQQEGLLLHATADRPRNSAVDESLIYGDHYFFEALLRAATPAVIEPYL
jgi:unsaturated chondroitin disaccharide hydrolase